MPVGAGLAIGGIGALGGGLFASKAQNHATDVQMTSNENALAYQKEKDKAAAARDKANYDNYNKQYAAYLDEYFPGYGAKFKASLGGGGSAGAAGAMLTGAVGATNGAPAGAPPGVVPPGMAGTMPVGVAPGPADATAGTIGGLMAAPGVPAVPGATPATGTLGGLAAGGWNDWKRYGVGN